MDLTSAIFSFCVALTNAEEQQVECFTRMANCTVPLGRDADENDLRNCKRIVKKVNFNKSEEYDE